MNLEKNNVSAFAKATQALAPAANAAGTRNGTGIDRAPLGFPMTCCLSWQLGAATGTPTSYTFDLKLQDSADNSTFADFAPDGPTGAGAITQQTAAGSGRLDIRLNGARQYVRVVEVTAFVGGTSPTLPAASTLIFSGTNQYPIP